MKVFLNEVAKQVFERFGSDFSKQVLVFPNRRSMLYFKKYLSDLVDKPILSPEIKTINELFQEWSPYQLADPLYLMFRLYDCYKDLRKQGESFDEFYYWGELIINDFDDLDKYLVNHNIIFQNLRDLRDIDAKFGGLEPEIVEIIRQFWTSFDPSNLTPEKDDFLSVWDILASLYSNFRELLIGSGMAYEGMLMREIIESLSSELNPVNKENLNYHFIGFNALNKCEKELLMFLKKKEQASFYWDYDRLYVDEEMHEAGYFIRDNISVFGQDLEGEMRYDNLISPSQPPDKYEVYKAPSDVAQAKLIPGILKQFDRDKVDPDDTAIVLADENMLMPVINSVPPSVQDINITMGYPIYQTPVYSLIRQLLLLRKNARFEKDGSVSFYHVDVMKLISHQYITFRNNDQSNDIKKLIKEKNLIRISESELVRNEFFGIIFSMHGDHKSYNMYLVDILSNILGGFTEENTDEPGRKDFILQQEYLYLVITSLNKLESILDESDISTGLEIYIRIVDKILHKLIVPFTGEPLCGLQVMGILETRALDFKNIIIMSVNEGILPKGSAGNSYIPYNLRQAFGLPTVKHLDSIYAYYFYRLIQRARKVRFIFNSSASGIRTGEMSRFLLQLKYNPKFRTVFTDSRFNIVPPPIIGEQIKRDAAAQRKLEDLYIDGENRKALSPSALNTWITCRMRFYYRYIIGLVEQENVKEEIDSPTFGTILHDVMNKLYSGFIGKEVVEKDLAMLKTNESLIEKQVERSFRSIYMKGNKGEISGKNLIITSVLKNMIGRILHIDFNNTPFKIVELEKKYYHELEIKSAGGRKILLGGIIDRVDELESGKRILDYKTGKDSLDIESLESLSSYNVRGRNSAGFQTFVYSLIYSASEDESKLRPSLYPVRSIYSESFSDIFSIKKGEHKGEVNDFSLLTDDFSENLNVVIADMFDPSRDFDMTTVAESCIYCAFNSLCGRYDVT